MARKRRKRRFNQSLARQTTSLRPRSLVHPADDFGAFEGGFGPPHFPTVRYPLIRTVLREPAPFLASRPRPVAILSPSVQARATGRSSDRRVRSPFLTSTGITPQLTDRALICAKRAIRREVLFASNRTGKGSQSPRRFSSKSKVRC